MSQSIHSKPFSERASHALKRRLFPHTGLRAHDLAKALRLSEATIWNVLSGVSKSGPSGRVLDLLVDFFGGGFLQEVFGSAKVYCIDPREGQKAAAIRKISEAPDELRRLG